MRIAYICYWNVAAGDGVADKINSQVRHWRGAGHEVEIFFLAQAPAYDAPGARAFAFSGARDRVRATARLTRAVRAAGPDLVYLRYDLFPPNIVRAFGRAPVVVELNSNAQAELRARAPAVALYESGQRRLLLSRVSAAIAVSGELADDVRMRFPQLDTMVIANGVDFTTDRESAPPGVAGPPRLVYLGDGVYWQGIDKIEQLAREFPDWEFDLVGVDDGSKLPNITHHGYLKRAEYGPIVASADVGIGTLALHRKEMDEASPLKVRRYLEFGLPVILGYTDTDLAGVSDWWVLRLPNTPANVVDSLEEIRAFVFATRGRRVPRSAVEPLVGAGTKETARLRFLSEVAARSAQVTPERSETRQ